MLVPFKSWILIVLLRRRRLLFLFMTSLFRNKVAEMVLNEKVEAWCLPMGSISRMIRAQSTHSPGHISKYLKKSFYVLNLWIPHSFLL